MKTALLGLPAVISLAAAVCCARVGVASELESRDAAFSLLIETFGQLQNALIEHDYQSRLRAAESLTDPATQRHVFDLARQERDLRVGKLKRQLAELAVAYHYTRPTGGGDGEVSVTERIDPAAAQSLNRFVLVGVLQAGDVTREAP